LDSGEVFGRITAWDWREKRVLQTIDTPYVGALDVDPAGRLAAIGFDVVALWDLESGARRDLVGISQGGEPEFSPDGSLIAVPFQTSVRLFDTANGQELLALRAGNGQLVRVAFSADGTSLAAHGLDGAYVWTLDPEQLIAIGRREVTRAWTDDECRRYLHLEACAP
jgi:hypothetical protein